MTPYNYKAELVMLNIERHPKKINDIIKCLNEAKKEFNKLKDMERYYEIS